MNELERLQAIETRLIEAYWKSVDSYRRFLSINQDISSGLRQQKLTLYIELINGFADILGYTPTKPE